MSNATSNKDPPATAINSNEKSSPPLILYSPGMDVGILEEWPFMNPKSNYKILDGTLPKAFGKIDSSTGTTRTGIWKCTVGKFECIEQGDELMTILNGRVEVTDKVTGQIVILTPGQSMFSYHGKHVIWNIIEDVTKVFYGYKVDGYD